MFNRLQQKPEAERRRLFWLTTILVSAFLASAWLLSFHSTIKGISLAKNKTETVELTEETTLANRYSAQLNERLNAFRPLLNFLNKIVPRREENIK